MRMKNKSFSVTAPTDKNSAQKWKSPEQQNNIRLGSQQSAITTTILKQKSHRPDVWQQPSPPPLYDINTIGSIEHWRLLLKQLTLLVGNKGSAAILLRSSSRLSAQYPSLSPMGQHQSWPEQLAILQYTLQQLPQYTAARVQQSLWWFGCQLLTKLLGVNLCSRLLQHVAQQSTNRNG